MVVEDTDHVRRMLTSMLTLDGFDVTAEAVSGSEALDRIDAAKPDVIVLDHKMPGMDGLTTAARIRDRHPDQVMILYTAYTDEDLERRAAEGRCVAVPRQGGRSGLPGAGDHPSHRLEIMTPHLATAAVGAELASR